LEWGGRALDLGIALNTSAIAILVPAESPATTARLSTNCSFMKPSPRHKVICLLSLQETLIVGWSAAGCGVMLRDATTAFHQHGITKLVRAVVVLGESLGNLV
jgi:hypothetical protein